MTYNVGMNTNDADISREYAETQSPIERLRQAGLGAFFRPGQVEDAGLSRDQLRTLVRRGQIEHVARGLYRLVDAEPTENYTLAAVCARVPDAIVCLFSALSVHELGTQIPSKVWIALPHKGRAPRIPEFPVKVVRFSGATLQYGIEKIQFEGVPARITNPARTVVDCFRFRRLVGHDVALEALRDALHSRKASPDEIRRVAEVCRARSRVMPVLEAILA